MCDVLEEMANKMPYRFFRLDILLSADMAILALQLCIAIEAILFQPFFEVAQAELILLKIVKFKWLWASASLTLEKIE